MSIMSTKNQVEYLMDFRANLKVTYNKWLEKLNMVKYGFPYAPGQAPRPVPAFRDVDCSKSYLDQPEAQETVLSVMVDIFKLQESIDMLRNELTLANNMAQNFHQYLHRIESMGRENNIPFSVAVYDRMV